jgi:hypothetical protein
MNVATVPGDYRLAHGVESTLRAVFPHVYVWQALRFNRFVIASGRELRVREAGPPALLPLLRRGLRESQQRGEPWTDDHSPVEWITDRMIVEYAAEGGRLNEMQLPTHP